MKTLMSLGKAAAVVSCASLFALYVYDRSGGNVSSWFSSSKADVVRPDTPTQIIAENVAEPVLFYGSKSFSGATVIDAGTLSVPPASPVTLLPGSKSPKVTMFSGTQEFVTDTEAETATLFAGPKSAPVWAVTPAESQPRYTAEQLHRILQQSAPNGPGGPQQSRPR
jgi:hypothetical protein